MSDSAPPLKLSKQEELIRQILTLAQSAYTARANWWQQQLKSRSIRRGVLQELDWPYPGASNPNIPMTDGFVRQKKATILGVLGLDPPVEIEVLDEGVDAKLGWRTEQWMADTYYSRMRVRRIFEPLVDGYLERSGYFVKVGYEREVEYRETLIDLDRVNALDQALFDALQSVSLEEAFAAAFKMDLADPQDAKEIGKAVKQYQAGKRRIRLMMKVVAKDQPRWDVLQGQELIRLPGMPKDIQLHPFLIHRFEQTVRQVRDKVRREFYEKPALELIKDLNAARSTVDWGERSGEDAQRIAEFLSTSAGTFGGTHAPGRGDAESIPVETWEVYTWWSPDPERVPARRARFTLFPAMHQGQFVRRAWCKRNYWPFQEFDYDNPSQDTYGGRSLPSMIESLAVQVNMLHKAYLDMLPWMASMSGTYDKNALLFKTGAPFALTPGEFIPQSGPGEALHPIRPPTAGGELLTEATRLQGSAEGLLGPLQSISTRRSTGQGTPTATEVESQDASQNKLDGMEVDSFQEAMNFVHEMTLDEMIDNMPEVVRFPYRGPGGQILFDEIRKEELEGKRLRIRAHGNLRNSSTSATVQRLTRWLAIGKEAVAMGVPVNLPKIIRDIFAADGARNPEEYVPEQQPMLPGGPDAQALQAMGGGDVPRGAVPPPAGGGPALVPAALGAFPAGAAR